ncbi:MAG: hypothetical protein Q7S55_04550 [Nanoarchaeota archaeon]|nr:hypothetical protein [Nanoarchaeota archaeon]
MSIEIYGKLEQIANESHPTRQQMAFFLRTLAQKGGHSAEELLDCIQTQTSWVEYTSKKNKNDFVNFVRWATGDTSPRFFSSLKKNESRTEPKKWYFNKGFARTVAHNEIALDIDTKEDFERAVRIFNEHELKGNCRTWEGAKGGHVSLLFSEPFSLEFKEMVRIFFHGDKGQINITVEGKPHQNTGNIVRIIAEHQGFNSKESLKIMFKNEQGGIQP